MTDELIGMAEISMEIEVPQEIRINGGRNTESKNYGPQEHIDFLMN